MDPYRKKGEEERERIRQREKKALWDWHDGQMKQIRKDNQPPKGSTGCIVLVSVPTVAIGLLTLAKVWFA